MMLSLEGWDFLCRTRAVALTDRPLGRSHLGRSPVLTMQVDGTAVAQERGLRPLVQ